MFSLKDLGPLHYFLGVETYFTANGIFLSQQSNIQVLLHKTNMHNTKPISSTMVSTYALSQHHDDPFLDSTLHKSIMSLLQYLSFTQLDIAFVVNKVCQFIHHPTIDQWSTVKRICHYLRLITHYGLFFKHFTSHNLQPFSGSH